MAAQQATQLQFTPTPALRQVLPSLTCVERLSISFADLGRPDDVSVAVLLSGVCQATPDVIAIRFLFNLLRKYQPQNFVGVMSEILKSPIWGEALRNDKIITTPESLLVLAETLRGKLAKANIVASAFCLDSASPLGNIARRIAFSLEKASFAKLCELVRGFQTAISMQKSNTVHPSHQLEQYIHLMAHDVLPVMLSSPKLSDVFSFLQGPPIHSLVSSVKWHFIQALEAVERCDLPKAVESLYVYFDSFGALSGGTDVNIQKSVVHVGFASLAIASFLLRLRSDDALPALQESVRLGLERGDSYLVALALYRFIAGALENGLLPVPYPLLLQLLAQAGVLAARRPPGAVPPLSAAEHAVMHTLMKATLQLQWPELVPLQEVLTSLNEGTTHLSLPASTPPSEVVSATLHHQRRALRAAVWERAGNSVLAETYWHASLSLHAAKTGGHSHSIVEGELIHWEADHLILSTAIDTCHTQLTGLSTGLPAFEPATRSALLLATESALGRHALHEAARTAQQLRAFSPVDAAPVEYLYARQLEAHVLLLRDRSTEAAALFVQAEHSIHAQWPHRGDLRLSLLQFSLELANACTRAGHPAAALPIVLHTLAVAETTQVQGVLHTEATLALVEVMLLLDIKAKCRTLVEDVLPQALQHGGHRLVSRTWLTLTRATLAEGSEADHLNVALRQLSYALAAASQVMDDTLCADVHYLRARLLHQLGRHEERNEAAKQFRLVSELRAHTDLVSCSGNIRALPEQLGALAEWLRARGA